MFTGIITDIGRVRAVTPRTTADCRIEIATVFDTAAIAIGASIACSGPCLTVVEKGPGWFAVDVSAETLERLQIFTDIGATMKLYDRAWNTIRIAD